MALGNWKKEAPTEEGLYWFSGIIVDYDDECRTVAVECGPTGDRYFLMGDSDAFESVSFSGLWTGPILPPER